MRSVFVKLIKAIKNPAKVVKFLIEKIKKIILWVLDLFEIIIENLFLINLKLKYAVSAFHVPLPMIGINKGCSTTSGKGQSSINKLEIISSYLPVNTKTILDIGSNNGFFSISLALKGYYVIGYEIDIKLHKIAVFVSRKVNAKNVAFFPLGIDPDNVNFIPEVDVSLVLSVFHWWVRLYGYDKAMIILRIIWKKTRKAMFFELPNTVENKKVAKWMPDMGDNSREAEHFIKRMLESLEYSKVELLAFLPTDFRPNERRHLFIVRKIQNEN